MAEIRFDGDRLYLSGALVRTEIPANARLLKKRVSARIRIVDLSAVTRIDSAGIGLIEGLQEGLFGPKLQLEGADGEVAERIETFAGAPLERSQAQPERFHIRDLFITFAYIARIFGEALALSGEIFFWSVVNIFRPQGHRKGEVVEQINTIGLNAVPIVATLSFIIGVILALQGAVQLERFGGGPFLADLMALAMIREMGPLLTAIIVTGRSGSAIASEIGTMQVTDEIDALRSMGIRPIEYVVAPKFLAFTVCVPLLSVLSAAVGVLGGLLVSVTFAGQPAAAFIGRAMAIVGTQDGVFLLLKGLLFGWAINVISCFCGFRVLGGAIEVGRATTQAVVASIFAIVMLNVVFSLWYLL